MIDRITRALEIIRQHAVGMTYVSGYENYKSTLIFRCDTCGSDVQVTYNYLQKKPFTCPKCRELKTHPCPVCGADAINKYCSHKCERRAEYRRRAARQQKIQKPKKMYPCLVCGKMTTRRKYCSHTCHYSTILKPKVFKPCAECGKLTARPKYCSEECSRKAGNRLKAINRDMAIRNALVDKDITLQQVYQNDMGFCYLCGQPCDYSDQVTLADGTIVCGDSYPSIEHVIPLSKGGKHAWTNVRLACRKCNSRKGAREYYPPAS